MGHARKQLIGQAMPPRIRVYKDGRIWRAEQVSFGGSRSGCSGSYEDTLRWVRRAIAKRETFFRELQGKGKVFYG